MVLNRCNQWLLLLGIGMLWATASRAQDEFKPASGLDRLPVWYPAYQSEIPAFEVNRTEQPTVYQSFRELAEKAKSGRTIESIMIDATSLKKGGFINLRQLPNVRVLMINAPVSMTAKVDSVFQFIQEWPLLERISLNVNSSSTGIHPSAQLVTIPTSLSRLPKLHDVRLSGNGIQWRPSFVVLAGLKNLRRLDISNWVPATSQQLNLSGFRQIRELRINGRSWEFTPETFAGLEQLTELTLSDVTPESVTLQQSLAGLTNLERLAIDNTRSLTKLSLGGLTDLKSVMLAYNQNLVVDTGTFAGLPAVEQLIIRASPLTHLTGICTLPQLRTLIISGPGRGQLLTVPDCIGQLTQLTELRIDNLRLSQLPAQLGALRGLKKLSLTNCGLDSLPASLARLGALQELLLSGNKLRQLPNLGQMRQLEQLNASNNQLTALPEDIGLLTRLKSIDVNTNKLTQLPASISRLINLRLLSVGGNQLDRLPDDLGKLSRLNSLWIGTNQLTALPDNLNSLDSLHSLVIGKNRLRMLPNSLTRLKDLKTLTISENELTALPADIGALRQLTELRLEQLPLTELPASIGQLTNLTALHITNTRLRLLPDNIGALSKLQLVFMSHNELIALPNSIGGWKEVTNMSLDGNKLEGLPNGIGRMTKLTTLWVSGREEAAGGVGGLQQLPDSIIYCKNLFSLSLLHQPQLDVGDVFTKASQLNYLKSINLTNCSISQLPVIDWKNVSWQSLELGHNALTELPVDILDAPSLMSVSVQANRLPDPLNNSFYGKDALRVAFVEAGQLASDRLSSPNRKVSEAYQQMAGRKAGQRDWEGAFQALQKAIDFAPDTMVALSFGQRAGLHFFRKEYSEALSDYDKAIQFAPNLRWDKVMDTTIASQLLVSFWQQKAAIFGLTGQYDTALSAITKAESYLPENGANSLMASRVYTERGRFLTMKNKLADADSSYRRAIRAYEKQVYADPAVKLTIVELSLLTGQYDRAKQAIANLPVEQMRDGYAILKEYLTICLSVLKGDQNETQATEQLTTYLSKHSARIYGWSFDLFDNWLAKAKLPSEKTTALQQLTNATKERLIKPE